MISRQTPMSHNTHTHMPTHTIVCSMQYGDQEDGPEWFFAVLEKLQGVFLRKAVGGGAGLSQSSRETTVIHHIFGGYECSTTTCSTCHTSNRQVNNIMNLQLPLESHAHSLEDCLKDYYAEGSLSGDNRFRCDVCDKLVPRATKQLGLKVAPNTLAIQIKRNLGPGLPKNNRHVDYEKNLSLTRYELKGGILALAIMMVLVSLKLSCAGRTK